MKISRRQFLSTVSVGAATLMLDTNANANSIANLPASTSAYQTVSLGRSGLSTSLLGMGTGFHGGKRSSSITRMGKDHAINIIKYAYDKGIRFFDCADLYGTHPHTKAALKSIPRDRYTLCTKIWIRPGALPEDERPDADEVVERFRKELDTDYIDLVQIHCMVDPHWTSQQKRQMDILSELKSKGIIKAHGVSVHSLEAMEACVGEDWVDVVHVRINAFGDSMDRKNPDEVSPVISKLHNEGKGIIGMKLIGAGNYKDDPDRIEKSLSYVLKLGTVDHLIVGFEEPKQIDNYAARLETALRNLH
jgi:aryl-alcohol dehydrogenase-like predicted oxidoreductase